MTETETPDPVEAEQDEVDADGSDSHDQSPNTDERLASAHALLETYQAKEIERLAAGLSVPADLLTLTGTTVADYINDDGSVDTDRVEAAVAAVITERPGLRRPAPATDPSQGQGNGVPKPSKPTWGGLFHP